MKIEVKHGQRVLFVEVPETATLLELKNAIAKETKVPASMQKLMTKHNVKDDTKTLAELGFKDGAKIMLIGNAVEAVVSAHGDSKAKEEKRAREVRNLPGNFWSLPPFAGILADPFVEGRGRPVEDGTAALSLLLMDVAMSRINTLGTNLATLALNDDAANTLDHSFLTLSSSERAILARAHAVLRKSLEFSTKAANAKSPEEVMLTVQSLINNIKSLPDNEWLLVPSGWVNLQYANVMYLLIKKNPAKPSLIYTADGSGDSYEVVVVNTDPRELGCLDFHPQLPTAEKLKAKACLTLPCISKERILDEAFWLLSVSLWIRANNPDDISEFARGEVIYDVLLPWLYEQNPLKVGGGSGSPSSPTTAATATGTTTAATAASATINAPNALPRDLSVLVTNLDHYRVAKHYNNSVTAAAAATAASSAAAAVSTVDTTMNSAADFITPQRSGSSATKALLAAFSFLLRQFGMAEAQVKQLKFTLKYEFFLKAAEDLHVAAKRHLSSAATVGGGAVSAAGSPSSATATATAAVAAAKKASPKSSAASSPLQQQLLPPKAQRLADSLAAMVEAGIDATTTNPTLSTLFDSMGNSDYVKTAASVLLKESHFEKKVVAVYFSAKWCPPCRRFTPLVVEVYNRLMERIPDAKNKLEFLFVSMDRSKEEFDEYSAKFPFPRMSWPVDNKVPKAFDITGIPSLLIFAPDGSLMTRDGVTAVRQDPEASKFPNAPWNGAVALTTTDLRMFEYSSAVLAHHALKKYEAGVAAASSGDDGAQKAPTMMITEAQLERIRTVITTVKAVADAMPHRNDDGTEGSIFDQDSEDGSAAEKKEGQAVVSAAANGGDELDALTTTVPDSAANNANSGMLNRVSTVKYAGTPFRSTVPSLGDLSNFRVPSDYASLLSVLQMATNHNNALWERSRHSGTSSRVAVQMQVIEFISWLFTFIVPIPKPSLQGALAINLDHIPPNERSHVEQFLRPAHSPIRDSVTSDLYDGELPSSPSAAAAAAAAAGSPTAADAGAQQQQQHHQNGNDDAQFQMCDAIYKLMLSYCTAWQAVETPSRAFDSERALVSVAMLCVYDAIARTVKGSNRGLILSILLTTDAGGYHMSTSLCKQTRTFKDISSTFELTRPQHVAVRDALVTLIDFNQLRYPNELFDLRIPDHIELRKHSHTVNFLRRFLENCGYRLGGGEDEEGDGGNNPQQQMMHNGRGGMMMGGRTQAQQMGGSEMEKLMYWFCDSRSPLAVEHPEFAMMRDMALLCKFMATMEMRDAQLLRKRKEFDEFASWRLSFEEDAPGRQMSAGWRTKPRAPFWDCLIVRGRDMDIADIAVKGFGDRSVSAYGEGLCVVSPIDVGAQLGVDLPLEEDVLHAKALPTFGGVLSQEEAEALWSVLTVPYMRIPLVLDFFSTQDRHTYLFAAPMQALLRSALFEPGAHIPLSSESYSKKFNVPMRLNAAQRQEAQIAVNMSATAEGDTTRFLGTTFGLLLNELQHSPQPVLGPWVRILQTVKELGPSSVYSVNATYVLFVCHVTCDILSFIQYALTMDSDDFVCRHAQYLSATKAVLEGLLGELVTPLLAQWLQEAEENDDIPTQCVVHSHVAMSQRALSLGQPLNSTRRAVTLVRLLQSCAFVRARHGFGMGFQRTQLASQDGDNTLSPEDKLLRFLQAQGLDTRSTSKAMLSQGRKLMMSGGRRRAVFVQIRGRNHSDTVRIPNLFRSDPTSTAESKALKLPPVDVPENLLFAILQEHFFELSGFIAGLSTGATGAAGAVSSSSNGGSPLDFAQQATLLLQNEAASSGSDDANAAHQQQQQLLHLDTVANAIVKAVLKDKVSMTAAAAAPQSPVGTAPTPSAMPLVASSSSTSATAAPATWVKTNAGVLAAPASSLVFHLQTCELFWKDEELKPVPDSMSHYDDYETILGKDIVQCGLVSRSEHRHWVHVVGTAYDLIEWTEHDPSDQGVHCPAILIGPPDVEKIEHVVYLGQSYTRPVDVYDEDPWPVLEERWAVKLVQQVYQAAFPMAGSMKYSPIMPDALFTAQRPSLASSGGGHTNKEVLVDTIRMVCYDKAQYDGEGDEFKATWKELIVTRSTTVKYVGGGATAGKKPVIPGPYGEDYVVTNTDVRLDVFTLVPHARRMYRVLHYSTSQRMCLAALELIRSKRVHNEYFKALRHQVGRLKNRIKNEGTLEIHRYNSDIGGREVYVPPRLLQGVVPSCLLENLLFWHGEDDIIRGYPGNSGAASAAIASASAKADTAEDGSASSKKAKKGGDAAEGDKEKGSKKDPLADDLAKAAGDAFANHWFNYSVEIELGDGYPTSSISHKPSSLRGGAKGHSVLHPNLNNVPQGSYRLIRRADRQHRRIRELPTRKGANHHADPNAAPQTAPTTMGDRSESEVLYALASDIDDKSLSTLRTLFGEFPDAVLVYGFKQCKRNVGKAVDWLADPDNAEVIQTLMPSATATAAAADESDEAVAASTSSNANTPSKRAGSSLLGGGMMGTSSSSDLAALAGASGAALGGDGDEVEQTTEENLELLRLADCPQLAPLADLLARIEDVSHILVWGRKSSSSSVTDNANDDNAAVAALPTMFDIQIIEFPRLRAKFQPKVEEGGKRTCLWLIDNPGWRVALPSEVFGDERMVRLMEPWEQCIAMKNVTTSELALFIPNHDFARMDVHGDPFNRMLLFDRGSVQWMESVPSPFYLMLVHTSKELLVAPSLAASLYAAVILTARQRYSEAFGYMEACYVDTAYSMEEQFMFSLMARTLTSASGSGKDNHPDAHAARLKFAHAALYSPNEVEWAVEAEVSRYLLKHQHVSRSCRLTREELTDLLKRCRRATPIIKCQLEYWVQLRQGRSSAKIIPPSVEKAGRPWAKLKAMPYGAVTSTCSKITRLQYKDPQQLLHEKALVEWLWEDKLVMDEESGANSSLGFYFLYNVFRKRPQCGMKFLGKDVTATMGSLLARWFQLRHARWGKEFSGAGEAQFVPSYMLVALCDVEAFPNAAWPTLTDPSTLGFMSRGGVSVNQQINTNNNRMWNRLGGGGGGGGDDDAWGGQQNSGPTPLGLFVRDLERCVHDIRRQSIRSLPSYPTADRIAVRAYDYIVPRVTPSNTAQERVVISGGEQTSSTVPFSTRTAASMATFLFEEVGIFEKFVTVRDPTATTAAAGSSSEKQGKKALPFDISQHSLAQSHVAKDMLRRLEGDCNTYEEQRRTTTQYLLTMLEAVNAKALFEPLWRCDDVTSSSSSSSSSVIAAAIATIIDTLTALIAALTALNAEDNAAVARLSNTLLDLANGIHTQQHDVKNNDADNDNAASPAVSHALSATLHQLHRAAGSRNAMTIEWLCGALLSTEFAADIAAVNPLHGDVGAIKANLVAFMMLSNRSFFGAQTIGAARQLLRFMDMVQSLGRYVYKIPHHSTTTTANNAAADDDNAAAASSSSAPTVEAQEEGRLVAFATLLSVDHDTNLSARALVGSIAAAMKGRFNQLTGALSEQVSVCRHYVERIDDATNTANNGSAAASFALDPRFLSFEFIFSIILRKRQVEMIRWFKSNIDGGNSRVQQMIMGQGKTTVVGPLLALMLADGKTLVTQVMPTALLEQSRNVLRRCFSVIIPKRIFTLQFDRGVEDSEAAIETLFQKLQSAQQNRSIVVSAPESIKALFLKYIEQLHALEATAEEDLMGGGGDASGVSGVGGARRTREAKLLKNKAIARSKMADAIVPILNMWREGVLLMDEVDVLLHPLRSELNFPIGLKHPIDLSGARWLLPIHILDGIFFSAKGRVSGTLAAASSAVKGVGAASSSPTNGASSDDAAEEQSCLEALRLTIAKGIESHTIQREPHVVLLDNHYYHTSMKQVITQWAILWLWRTVSKEQARLKRQAERQGQLAELARMAREQRNGGDNHDDETDNAAVNPADAINLNISKERFYHLAKAFLLESRVMSSSANASSGYESLLALGSELSTELLPTAVQLFFLARDWLDTLLPHVLAKINRVGYGILQSGDFASLGVPEGASGGGIPLSRRLMAIPFVAKDVPSRSSEFAHPDVVIGLTILAYRYEGLRRTDVKELLLQLKQDYSRQTGPRERRPAAVLFSSWLAKARADRDRIKQHAAVTSSPNAAAASTSFPASSTSVANATDDDYASIPLSQLQVLDPTQLNAVYKTLRTLPEAAHYYLCQHTFPRTMNFQKLKLSACGHELASNILFGKRIGFSGTPSNLLPLDMGECAYEPGSDGKILDVLTDPAITSSEQLGEGWTPLKVLKQIATANPPFHALIDTGALITNMDNEQVARYLMEHLPSSFEGVVFLDARDKQVVLQRNNMQIVPLSQCGVALSRRFTFFDQVHTTGMDIKQSPTATAVVTIGKDMVFRDYAQGAFRMRGIGKGQRIRLFLIPEVVARVRESLIGIDPSAASRSSTINIPAWLLLNAMRIEGLQFVKLSAQELENVWRKLALRYLVKDSSYANSHPSKFTDLERVRRFGHSKQQSAGAGADGASGKATNVYARDAVRGPIPADYLASCIASFREVIGFPVPDHVELPVGYSEKIRQHFDAKPKELLVGPTNADGTPIPVPATPTAGDSSSAMEAAAFGLVGGSAAAPPQEDQASVDRIAFVMKRMLTALDVHDKDADEMGLNAEVVHEQEAEEEQEQEAEQEEQRISAFTRDDEQQIGWDVRVINSKNAEFARGVAVSSSSASSATAASAADNLVTFESPFYACSEFRVRQEQPQIAVPGYLTLSDNFYRKRWAGLGERKLRNCVVFVQWVIEDPSSSSFIAGSEPSSRHHTTQGAAITLAEAETLRWLLHHNNAVQSAVPVAIRIVGSGRYVEASSGFRRLMGEATAPPSQPSIVGSPAASSKSNAKSNTLYAAECYADFLSMSATADQTAAAVPTATTTTPPSSAPPLTLTDPLALWYRFFNNDMFYTPEELSVLAHRVLHHVSLPDRVAFFMECLRLRRRHRNDFEDAPIAELFTADEDRDELKDIAELKKLEVALVKMARAAEAERQEVVKKAGGGGKGNASSAADHHHDPAFMTEDEQLAMLLNKTAAESAAANDQSSFATGLVEGVNPFIALLRRAFKARMTAALSASPPSSSSPSSPQKSHLTAAETAGILRESMQFAVREAASRQSSGAAPSTAEETVAASSSPSGDSGAVANVRLPPSLAALDLDAAMSRVESMLLERALHQAKALSSTNGISTTSSADPSASFKITYDTLLNALPVLHVDYEAIEEAKAAAAKAAKKAAKRKAKGGHGATNKKKSATASGKKKAAATNADGVPTALIPWNCPSCTFYNEGHVNNCEICYTERPPCAAPAPDGDGAVNAANDEDDDNAEDDGEEEEGSDAEGGGSPSDSDDDDESVKPPVDWSCPACTFFNEASARECSICNTPNPTPLPAPKKGAGAGDASSGGAFASAVWEREVPDGVWVCSVEHGGCSMYNPDNWFYCKACDKARPNLASMRF